MNLELETVLRAYGLEGEPEPLAGGLINTTFLVRSSDGGVVLQRLHPVFSPEVNLDIDAVTRFLETKHVRTPRLVRTLDDKPWLGVGDHTWRALTYLGGTTVERITNLRMARSAGELVGTFHRALDDFQYQYASVRAGVHDTAAHLDKLRRLSADNHDDEGRELARAILDAAAELGEPPPLRRRHCHGDLKIANVLFHEHVADRAMCLVDLDTMGFQTMFYELGDMLRSWCNQAGEDDAQPRFDDKVFDAALAGYVAGSHDLLEPEEVTSVPDGVATVCLELAARFAADVFEDSYFGWDQNRYGSRRQHNLVRARGQLNLHRQVKEQRQSLRASACALLG